MQNLSMDCKIPFLTKCLDNSYCHRGRSWSCGMFHHPTRDVTMGDAISHAVLPGVALSFILGLDFFIGAIVFGLLAAIIITYIKGNSIIKSDTAIGITFSSFLALGIILISVAKSSTDLFHILLVISWPSKIRICLLLWVWGQPFSC